MRRHGAAAKARKDFVERELGMSILRTRRCAVAAVRFNGEVGSGMIITDATGQTTVGYTLAESRPDPTHAGYHLVDILIPV